MMEKWKPSLAARVEGEPQKSHISELYLPGSNHRFGFRIGGLLNGPDVVVACQAALARQVYQRLLLIPGLNRLKGRLFLISLDRLDDLHDFGSLRGLLGVSGPIDHILTLPAVELETLDESAAAELVRRNYYAVLRLCARMGMVQGWGIPDRDAPLA
ncbi:hypothetical protein [Roseovarius sp. SYSU LYC5161]|uniref:hypothetical protein n=1 Tax=Roseovarius halophilus (ex Wu et al. 2025) TaxID=3376060 RepID=UPI00399B6A32